VAPHIPRTPCIASFSVKLSRYVDFSTLERSRSFATGKSFTITARLTAYGADSRSATLASVIAGASGAIDGDGGGGRCALAREQCAHVRNGPRVVAGEVNRVHADVPGGLDEGLVVVDEDGLARLDA